MASGEYRLCGPWIAGTAAAISFGVYLWRHRYSSSKKQARAVDPISGQHVHYLGIFLDDASRSALCTAASQRHPIAFYHHMTVLFQPTQAALDEVHDRLGEGCVVEMAAQLVAEDAKGQAVLVRPVGPIADFVHSDVPHVTMSCADGVSPVYSNTLLQTAVTKPDELAPILRFDDGVRLPLTLTGRLGIALSQRCRTERWAYAPLSMSDLASDIQTLVPDEWLWTSGQGGKVPTTPMAVGPSRSGGLHCTVLLGMDTVGGRDRLRAVVASVTMPPTLTIEDIFVDRVKRLAEHDVWCVGLSLACPCIRAIRDRWLESVPADLRPSHVPYMDMGDGHASLVYFKGEHRAQVQAAVSAGRGSLLKRAAEYNMQIPCVVYQDRLNRQFERMSIGSAI